MSALAIAAALLAAVIVAAAAAFSAAPRLRERLRHGFLRRPTPAVVAGTSSTTSTEGATGAVRSLQTAELLLPAEALEQLWSPEYLERLARTYWRFLSRVTLGLLHVHYTERERSVVVVLPALRLLTFDAPEYEMDPQRGLVRWRIVRGLLVARRGRDGHGYLQIEVLRRPSVDSEQAHLRVEVEVASFYPAIAQRFSRRIYDATQSRIHVIVTRAFLRSLRRLDLAESRVGRLSRGG
jgi:hypothetical protein